jgi:hypothetical protein
MGSGAVAVAPGTGTALFVPSWVGRGCGPMGRCVVGGTVSVCPMGSGVRAGGVEVADVVAAAPVDPLASVRAEVDVPEGRFVLVSPSARRGLGPAGGLPPKPGGMKGRDRAAASLAGACTGGR